MNNIKTIILVLVLHVSVSNSQLLCTENQRKLDLAFVIDDSSSINGKDFERQKQFVIDIIDNLYIDGDKTRVAAITFSNHVFEKFSFSAYSTKEEMKNAVRKIQYSKPADATRTYEALKYTRQIILNQTNGQRKDAVGIVVVLTDGVTNSGQGYDNYNAVTGPKQTQIEAAKIKEMGAHIFAIGVGKFPNTRELNGISSDPDTTYTIQVPSFGDLNTDKIKEMLINRICKYTPPDDPHDDPKCINRIADVFFILDDSVSIDSEENFQKEINFTISVVEELDVGPRKSRVGVMTFSKGAYINLYMNEANTRNEVAQKLQQLKWRHGSRTDLDQAFKLLRTRGFNSRYRDNYNTVPKIVVVITDGDATNPYNMNQELKKLHQENYTIFAIGVGPLRDQNELESIANNRDRVFKVESNDALSSIRRSLAIGICDKGISASELRENQNTKPKHNKKYY